jgi:chemotaxis protein methyltransferase CheR
MLTPDETPRSTLGAEIGSRNPEVRWRVAAVLADLPGAEPEALLLRLMGDTDYRVREKSVSILARRFSPRIADACVETLSGTRDPLRRAAAAGVLARVGEAGRPALLSALSHESPTVRLAAARSLPGRHAAAPTVAALEAAMRLDADANVRAALILALGRSGRREALAPLLLELASPSLWLRVHALEALGEVGDPAVAPRLLPLLNDASLRDGVLRAFARLESPAPAEELARRAAAGEHDALLIAALRRSAEATTPETRPRLARLWPGAPDVLKKRLRDPATAPAHRTDAAHLLACLEAPGTAEELLKTGPFLDGFATLNLLSAARRVEALPEVLQVDDPEAALTLIEGAEDEDARRALSSLLGHPSPAVRSAVLGSVPPGTIPVGELIDLLAEEGAETALPAAFALASEAHWGSPDHSRAAHSALLDRASGADGPGRAAALVAIAASDDPNVDSAVRAGLSSPDPAVRRAAARAAGQRPRLSEEDLRSCLKDDDAAVRAAALRSLARWAEVGRASTIERKDLLLHLADEPVVAAAAGAALVAISGSGRPRLVREMLAQKGPVRRAAIEEIPATQDSAAAEAVAFAVPHEDPETARAVLSAMAVARPEVAIEAIGQGLADPRPEVRQAAAEAAATRPAPVHLDGPLSQAIGVALAGESVAGVVNALLHAVAKVGGPSSIEPLTRVLALEQTGEDADRAAEAVARRYPDLVRQAWITAPARAARRLSRALAAAGKERMTREPGLTPAVFRLYGDLVRKRTGLVIPESRRHRLTARLWAQARVEGSFAHLYSILREMSTDSAAFGQLLDAATDTSSTFFEDPASLRALTEEIAPERLLALGMDGVLDVWCVGCARGEEAYSMAMQLQEKGIAADRRMRIRGTDVSPEAIRQAREGAFSAHSLRTLSPERRTAFFEPVGEDRFRVKEPIRSAVYFAARSLLDEPKGSGTFDAIVCRNVLPFLEEDVRGRAVETLALFLKPGGYLLLGREDGLAAAATPLTLVPLHHDIAYRR